MYLVKPSCIVFNSFNSKLCIRKIFSQKKKFMHRAVAKKKTLAQEMSQKINSGRLKIPHPPSPDIT